jgi:hypothetical protein
MIAYCVISICYDNQEQKGMPLFSISPYTPSIHTNYDFAYPN